MELGAPSREGLFVHKNQLQEITQRAAIPLPSYQTTNEGYPHAPQFRSIVVVDGTTFTSSHTYLKRKAAEQAVAKVAFEGISTKIKHKGTNNEGTTTVGDPEGPFVHKNRLQEFTQRAAIPLPSYHTTNAGYPHAPQFKSTVVVDGTTFTSSHSYVQKKAAEQDVAKVAFEGISAKIQHEGVPLIHEDSTFCKSILHEYAVKMNFEKPTYTTSQAEGLLPMFISSSVFNGETFTGSPGKNKKEAEQLAARTIIKSILANSNTRTMMCEIIKMKGKLYAAINKCSYSVLSCDKNMVMGTLGSQTQENNNSCVMKGQEIQATLSNGDKLPGNTYPGEIFTTVPATESRLSQAINIEEYTCDLSSGTVGNVYETYVVQEGPPAAVIHYMNNSSVETHRDENNQVNDGKKQILPHLAPGDSPSVVLNRGRNRSNKKRKRKRERERKQSEDSKKARADEQLPVNVASASTVNLQEKMPVMNECAPVKVENSKQ